MPAPLVSANEWGSGAAGPSGMQGQSPCPPEALSPCVIVFAGRFELETSKIQAECQEGVEPWGGFAIDESGAARREHSERCLQLQDRAQSEACRCVSAGGVRPLGVGLDPQKKLFREGARDGHASGPEIALTHPWVDGVACAAEH